MKDIKIWELCKECAKPLSLIASCREDDTSYLVIRCLNCGQHPLEEIARLDKDQTELYKYEDPPINFKWKEKK